MAERHSDKSPDAFRTISEVADHLDLPQHVLRFWETKFPEIKPVKRAGGRRFYRPEDVDLLRAIRHLLYAEGYTIKGVQKILKDQGARGIQAMGADLLDGRPVEVASRAATDLPAAPKGGLLGSLIPGRRNRNEARIIADDATPAFDEPPLEDEPPAYAPRAAEPRRAQRPAAGFERQDPRLSAGDPDFSEMPPRGRRASDRTAPDLDPPDAFLPGFEVQDRPRQERSPPQRPVHERTFEDRTFQEPPFQERPLTARSERHAPPDLDAFADYPDDRIARAPRFDDVRPDPYHRAEPRLAPDDTRFARHDMPAPPRAAYVEPAPQPAPQPVVPTPPVMRRPSRGPASRVPEPAPLPELEDPLLPFFDDEVLTPPENVISEPLNERIRRLKEHVPPPVHEYDTYYDPEPVPQPPRARMAPREDEGPRPTGRVGPLTGVFPDDIAGPEPYARSTYGQEAEEHFPAEPRRQGPPEQYLPPHLRSEPRMTAAPVHAPQPILSRDDMHRLQSALYELGECRRLLTESLRSEDN